jgi:cytochrome oxidase Cu insertion factor (SCO1/SenC/PrrC family)
MLDTNTGNISIQPKVCDINVDDKSSVKNLADEPGIPEFMKLYLDDKYDFSNGTFTGMSDETKKQFFKDLKTFYVAFTGNENMPPEITKFSDIKLRDYKAKQGCQGENPILKSKINLNKKDKLYVDYAENVNKMIQRSANNQYKLLSVINELFTYVIDPFSKKRVIRVNPKLNDNMLKMAVEKTRRFIIDLYVSCENDYVNGVKIYEAIVESNIIETTQKQIENLKNKANEIIETTKKTDVPEMNVDISNNVLITP